MFLVAGFRFAVVLAGRLFDEVDEVLRDVVARVCDARGFLGRALVEREDGRLAGGRRSLIQMSPQMQSQR